MIYIVKFDKKDSTVVMADSKEEAEKLEAYLDAKGLDYEGFNETDGVDDFIENYNETEGEDSNG